MSSIVTFNFVTNSVRVIMRGDEPWFVAVDVCEALTIGNSRMALDRLDDDEKGVSSIDTPGGNQELSIINESGLYSLILTSRKPEAKKFKKWVTAEVLPAIRKTGRYEAPIPMPALVDGSQLSKLSNQIWLMARAFYMEGSVRYWLGKYACARAGVSRRDHIPASLYPEVEDFLRSIDRAVTAYREDRIQQEHKWLLLTLKRELDKRMGRLGPEFEMLAEDRKGLTTT
ncbi:MAG: Bro-N domain-containing protein [Candidatus Saccharimonadales bacterium]